MGSFEPPDYFHNSELARPIQPSAANHFLNLDIGMTGGLLGVLGRLVGVSYFTAKGKFSIVLSVWGIACLALFAVLMAVAEYQELSEMSEDKKPGRKILEIALQLSDIGVSLTHYTVQNLRKRTFEEVLHYTRKTRSRWYDSYLLAFGMALFLGMVFDPWDETFQANSTFWTLHRHDLIKIYHFIVFIIVLQFCSIVSRISTRLQMACRLLERTNTAIQHHAKLIHLAKTTNRLWNLQLLQICFHIFGYVVLLFFDGVNPLINKTKANVQITSYVNLGLTMALTLTQLFCMAYSCNRTTYQADVFNEELFKLLENHPSYSKDEKLNLYLNFNETIQFSACGFFGLGYPMITAITATTASYLVILLQSA